VVKEHRLGIDGLPAVAGKLAAGRIYVVTHEQHLGLELICKTIGDAETSARAEWFSEAASAYLDAPSALRLRVDQAVGVGKLRIFQIKEVAHKNICRDMLEEVKFLNAARGTLIVVEGVDLFVNRDDVDAWGKEVVAWKRWAERAQCTVLWLCPQRTGQASCEAEIMRQAHHFSGLSLLRKVNEAARWDVYYWFAHEGLIVDKSYLLSADGQGGWRVDARKTWTADTNIEYASDEDEIFMMRAALPSVRSAPSGWHIFETAEEMQMALTSASSPTVVFNYRSDSPLETIVRWVFDLRRAVGPHIKIAVKEAGRPLRHSHEQLLLNVGANLIIPSDTGMARLLSLLKSLQGYVYSRTLPASIDDIMGSVMDVSKMGYLAPEKFVAEVSHMLVRSQSLQVHSALVRLFLLPGLSVLDTLRCCTIKRPGDLCTADNESLFVFLFACEDQAIGATLDRLFRLPISVLFATQERYLSNEDVAVALADFAQRDSVSRYTNFAGELTVPASIAMPSTHQGVASNTSAPITIRPAFRAKPHALKLRSVEV